MKILVLNCGSSSVKFRLSDGPVNVLARGLVERIGEKESRLSCRHSAGTLSETLQVPDHRAAIQEAVRTLTGAGVIEGAEDIGGVGHRIVHGGEFFRESVRIDAQVESAIEQCSALAPLHNPHNLNGYRAIREILPDVTQVAVFDTAFHSRIPPIARFYALPDELYTRHGIRRYGFHGTSHRYVTRRLAEARGVGIADLKVISCHLGNGCSMAAVDAGRSVDTSMGFTPLEGLMMGTRAGDIDAGVVLQLAGRDGMTPADLDRLLNHQSGLQGVSGISNDMRDLLRERELGNERATLAIAMFCYRILKYLGAYLAVLGSADAVVFTGGIGENSWQVRAESCSRMAALGLRIDPAKNRACVGTERRISSDDSGIEVWVIPTDEERLIAADTERCILGQEMD